MGSCCGGDSISKEDRLSDVSWMERSMGLKKVKLTDFLALVAKCSDDPK
jgi:Fe-S-cluster formation regulator IscX/YfhJ